MHPRTIKHQGKVYVLDRKATAKLRRKAATSEEVLDELLAEVRDASDKLHGRKDKDSLVDGIEFLKNAVDNTTSSIQEIIDEAERYISDLEDASDALDNLLFDLSSDDVFDFNDPDDVIDVQDQAYDAVEKFG